MVRARELSWQPWPDFLSLRHHEALASSGDQKHPGRIEQAWDADVEVLWFICSIYPSG